MTIARFTLAAVYLACSGVPGAEAAGQKVVLLDPGNPTAGRLIIGLGTSEAHQGCPASGFQFSLDPEDTPEWTHHNRELWDESAVISAVRSSVSRARAKLPIETLDICIGIAARPPDPTLQAMGGVGAAAFAPATMVVFVAPSLDPSWLQVLSATVAHEYHHLAVPTRAPRGLDVLIREGKAHHFAAVQEPGVMQASARALTTAQLAPAWETIRADLNAASGQFLRRYMFGGPYFGGVVPRWAGYTVGYCLVWAYSDSHPELTVAELGRVKAEAFVSEEVRCP